MTDWLLRKLGAHYVPVMMVISRVISSLGGALTIYYVDLVLDIPEQMQRHFNHAASVVVVLAVVVTLLMAQGETRRVRAVLRALRRSLPVEPARLAQATHDAVEFPARHHMLEAMIVPCITTAPACLFLRLVDGAPSILLVQIAIATFMGIALALLSTFFFVERWMEPVIRALLRAGAVISPERLPSSQLRVRLNVCFSLIIVITALLIGTLANNRAMKFNQDPFEHTRAVMSLRQHTTYISLAALVVGAVLATRLAQSVASRVDVLVQAMRRVEQGNLSERVLVTATDEIATLSWQFNSMVEQLNRHHQTIRELNATLERKVLDRTEQLDQRNRELEHAMQELRATQSQLVQSEKMSSLGQLVAGIAHELNNSINAVYNGIRPLQWKAEELQEQVSASLPESVERSEQRQRIGEAFARISLLATVIEHGASRTVALVNDLKTFSHPGSEASELFDLHESLEMCLNLLVNELKHRIAVHRDYGDVPPVFGPQGQLNQVFMNVLNNAQQSMGERGEIHLMTRREGDEVVVRIRDTGGGIDREIEGRIFDPFFTTKPPGVGTGLGLSISYGIIQRLGGAIEVESTPGSGSAFTIRFPAATTRNNEPDEAARESVSPAAAQGVF